MDSIPVSELKPGMVVINSVSDTFGQVLLEANTTITPEIIRMLRSWGVERVTVAPGEARTPAQSTVDMPHNEALKAALDDRFRLTRRDHPAIEAIFSFCLEYSLQRSLDRQYEAE